MKKLLVVLGLLLLMTSATFAQIIGTKHTRRAPTKVARFVDEDSPTYFVTYFSNNSFGVPGSPDQTLRVINSGKEGTPLTSPVGDVCANIYVFDNNQEMSECCACRITPNELMSASIATDLTANPLTGTPPAAGVIKVVLTPGQTKVKNEKDVAIPCDPTAQFDDGTGLVTADDDLGTMWATHVQVVGGRSTVTEAIGFVSLLSWGEPSVDAEAPGDEATFLPLACSFTQYLGSGKGTCTCRLPGL